MLSKCPSTSSLSRISNFSGKHRGAGVRDKETQKAIFQSYRQQMERLRRPPHIGDTFQPIRRRETPETSSQTELKMSIATLQREVQRLQEDEEKRRVAFPQVVGYQIESGTLQLQIKLPKDVTFQGPNETHPLVQQVIETLFQLGATREEGLPPEAPFTMIYEGSRIEILILS